MSRPRPSPKEDSDLSTQHELHIPEQFVSEPSECVAAEPGAARRAFVEPEISAPVDVLETTTFFQGGGESLVLP